MSLFKVKKSFYLGSRDLVVLTGEVLRHPVQPGMFIDLPRGLRGPGRVPIHSVEFVRFANDVEDLCVTFQYHHLATAPLMELSSLEGCALEVLG